MIVTGNYTLDAPRDRVWAAIYDLKSLLAIIPGCQDIKQVSDTEYRGHIQMRLPAVVGSYQSHMKLVEFEEPHYSRFEGAVEGSLGAIKGTASFRLYEESEGQTIIEYEGQGLITGSLSRLNSRFAEGLAKSLVKQGLSKLNKQIYSSSGSYSKSGTISSKGQTSTHVAQSLHLLGLITLVPLPL